LNRAAASLLHIIPHLSVVCMLIGSTPHHSMQFTSDEIINVSAFTEFKPTFVSLMLSIFPSFLPFSFQFDLSRPYLFMHFLLVYISPSSSLLVLYYLRPSLSIFLSTVPSTRFLLQGVSYSFSSLSRDTFDVS
jgi:hypothetical protein